MRAFISLARHILGSYPHINGYFELHIGYEDQAALDRQLELFEQQLENPRRALGEHIPGDCKPIGEIIFHTFNQQ